MTARAPIIVVPQSLSKESADMARRRFQRTGYLYTRGPSWFLQYREEQVDGSRPVKTVRLGDVSGPEGMTRKEAERAAWKQYLSKVDRGVQQPKSHKTFAQFVSESFERDVIWCCKPSGQAHYHGMLDNHVLPAIGNVRLCDVDAPMIQALVRAKLQKLSVQTAIHIRNTISAVFGHAKRCGAFSGDLPTEGVRLPALQAVERRALTWKQVEAIAAVIGKPDLSKPRKKHAAAPTKEKISRDNAYYGSLVMVLALTGLRIGEACGLRWKHVNLTMDPRMVDGNMVLPCTIAVRENYVRGVYGTLKTVGSKRDIPLTSLAVRVLKKIQKLTKGMAVDPVFAGEKSGKPIDQHNVAKDFLKPAAKRAGVPWASWHTFRHTSASLADQAGLSVTERQRVLGHSAAAMTLRYSHADLDVVRARMERIGKGMVN